MITTLCLSYELFGFRLLIENLLKAIHESKRYSLRSLIRLRGVGGARKQTYGTIDGAMRLEAIVPDISFQCLRINPIPVLSTPLSINLIKKNNLLTNSAIGYLTLNQIRNVVMLLETDVSVALAPIVGLWVALPVSEYSDCPESMIFSCLHVWGACVRFLTNKAIQSKVFVGYETFLLVCNPFEPIAINR